MPNQDENDIEDDYEVSDRRPTAAEPWSQMW